MSWQVKVCRAKPNPAGKDSGIGAARQEQLLGEWVDLQSTGDGDVTLSQIHLSHTEFSAICVPTEKAKIYWTGRSDQILRPGQIVRVHTGKSAFSSYIQVADQTGVHLHAYAESGNFILNNRCGDALGVWWKDSSGKWQKEDWVEYAPNPGEGRILIRQGDKLV